MTVRPAALRIIATGGTFDKVYDPATGELGFTESHLPALVAQARLTFPTTIEIVFLLDSLDLRDDDRARILAACSSAAEAALVVVHGTDTMPETARLLGPAFAVGSDCAGKTVVLTGAMIPCSVENSDALFNLGFACAAAQTLPHGVHVAMNGRVFPWDKVEKNRAAGVFEETR